MWDAPTNTTAGTHGGGMAEQSPGGNGRSRAGLGGGAIASLVGLALLLIFILQNTEKVRLHFLVWYFVWPLWIFTIVMAVIGAVVWLGLGVIRRHRRRRDRRERRRG